MKLIKASLAAPSSGGLDPPVTLFPCVYLCACACVCGYDISDHWFGATASFSFSVFNVLPLTCTQPHFPVNFSILQLAAAAPQTRLALL